MKSLFFAAALMVSSVAIAQTGNTVSDPDQSSGPRGVTQQGTDPNGEACTPAGYNAGGSGYPPCTGAEASGGMASTTTAGGGGTIGSGTRASGALPPCSRTVTDGCIQTYERGVRRR